MRDITILGMLNGDTSHSSEKNALWLANRSHLQQYQIAQVTQN